MFKIIDVCGYVHDAYGTCVDDDGTVQFILCRSDGTFYQTNRSDGFYRLYTEDR